MDSTNRSIRRSLTRVLSLFAAVLWTAAAGCGGDAAPPKSKPPSGPGAETPRAAVDAMNRHVEAGDYAATWDLLAPAARTELERSYARMSAAQLAAAGDPASARELYAAQMKQVVAAVGEQGKGLFRVEVLDMRVREDTASAVVRTTRGEDTLTLVRVDGRWYFPRGAGPAAAVDDELKRRMFNDR